MSARYAIFCADPLNTRSVEPSFAAEFFAASEAGFTPVLLNHDSLDGRIDAVEALRKTRITEPGAAVYRGWMLRGEAYRALHEALSARGVRLLTSADAYEACHHTPGSYDALKAFMPKTVWVVKDRLDQPEAIAAALGAFGDAAVVIKDWVKSQADGYWAEACFVPNATDGPSASRVIARFRELQGDSLVGGVVFKSYVPLVPADARAAEHRAFMVDGQAIGCWPRSDAAASRTGPPLELLAQIASIVPSPFASADFGVDDDGRWWLIEVGDGQVSGLPSEAIAGPLFQALGAAISMT